MLDVRLGDTPPEGNYDLILANIHRNILIAQMPDYSRFLKEGGELWLSGFYETDCAAIISEASRYGLETIDKQERGEWRWLAMKKLLIR